MGNLRKKRKTRAVQGREKTPEKMVYIALLHGPVYDKNGRVVTTCVTNLDLHDIARVARTYNVGHFYVVHPVASQEALIRRLVHHWEEGFGARYNATRKEAFASMTLCRTLSDVREKIRLAWEGKDSRIVVTAAGRYDATICIPALRKSIQGGEGPLLLLFGTGWGLSEEVVREADDVLEPIRGADGYNHLSVRSAVSIVIDRLLGER